MADDMANCWGTNYVLVDGRAQQKKRSSNSAPSASVPDANDFKNFLNTIHKDTGGQFTLTKTTPNGSDSNLFAVNSITDGNNDTCLVAAGSYVAGDYGPFHKLTTAKYHMNQGPSYIQKPDEVQSEFTKMHTCGLPYHIPTAIVDGVSATELVSYENRCLSDLHNRLLYLKMKGTPVRCILLELILANNGSTLSNRALRMLGQLAKHHNFKFVVDEIMTGGRVGDNMLACMSTPLAFQEEIGYVTMGKWFKMGLVLATRKQYYKDLEKTSSMPRRGQSTAIPCEAAERLWKAAVKEMANVTHRRRDALNKLGVSELVCWGKGLMIFGPIKRLSPGAGTKCRFLPMLHNTPFDKIKVQRGPTVPWTRIEVHHIIMKQSESWLEQPYVAEEEDEDFFTLASAVADFPTKYFMSTKEYKESVLTETRHNTKSVTKILRKAEAAGIMAYVMRGEERLRGWEVLPFANAPWGNFEQDKEEDDEEETEEEE